MNTLVTITVLMLGAAHAAEGAVGTVQPAAAGAPDASTTPSAKGTGTTGTPGPAEAAEAVALGAAALGRVSASGADLSVLWGVPSAAQREAAQREVGAALGALRGVGLSDDARAVVLGRALALHALLATGEDRAAALNEARTVLESVEGPPTAGEAVRRLSLAAVLSAAGGAPERAQGEALVRSVLDLPVGERPLETIPRSAQLEALVALVGLAEQDERAARTSEVAREQFGDARDRALVGEALARRAARARDADGAPESPRARWERAIQPLEAVRTSSAYAPDAEQNARIVDSKIAELTRGENELDALPVRALLARASVASLEEAAARAAALPAGEGAARSERDEALLEALRALARVHREAKPPERARAIDAQARAVELAPKHREVEGVLRRAQQDLDEWERALVNGPWKKDPLAAAPDAEIDAALGGIERLRAAVAAQGRTDGLESRLQQRALRVMIKAGRARGVWGERALATLALIRDDPGLSDQTVALARSFLDERHPPKAAADAPALAHDLARVLEHATLKRQPWQLTAWRARLAGAQQGAGDHEGALGTWQAMLDDQSAAYLPQGESTARLGRAGSLRALKRYDEAERELERVIAPYDSALASRPAAYWQAWVERLSMALDREDSEDARARVRLRVRQLRASDATLGSPATRAALEALEIRAGGPG